MHRPLAQQQQGGGADIAALGSSWTPAVATSATAAGAAPGFHALAVSSAAGPEPGMAFAVPVAVGRIGSVVVTGVAGLSGVVHLTSVVVRQCL
jgi:hypothetical protein